MGEYAVVVNTGISPDFLRLEDTHFIASHSHLTFPNQFSLYLLYKTSDTAPKTLTLTIDGTHLTTLLDGKENISVIITRNLGNKITISQDGVSKLEQVVEGEVDFDTNTSIEITGGEKIYLKKLFLVDYEEQNISRDIESLSISSFRKVLVVNANRRKVGIS